MIDNNDILKLTIKGHKVVRPDDASTRFQIRNTSNNEIEGRILKVDNKITIINASGYVLFDGSPRNFNELKIVTEIITL